MWKLGHLPFSDHCSATIGEHKPLTYLCSFFFFFNWAVWSDSLNCHPWGSFLMCSTHWPSSVYTLESRLVHVLLPCEQGSWSTGTALCQSNQQAPFTCFAKQRSQAVLTPKANTFLVLCYKQTVRSQVEEQEVKHKVLVYHTFLPDTLQKGWETGSVMQCYLC